jgi:hypothetical protein
MARVAISRGARPAFGTSHDALTAAVAASALARNRRGARSRAPLRRSARRNRRRRASRAMSDPSPWNNTQAPQARRPWTVHAADVHVAAVGVDAVAVAVAVVAAIETLRRDRTDPFPAATWGGRKAAPNPRGPTTVGVRPRPSATTRAGNPTATRAVALGIATTPQPQKARATPAAPQPAPASTARRRQASRNHRWCGRQRRRRSPDRAVPTGTNRRGGQRRGGRGLQAARAPVSDRRPAARRPRPDHPPY